MFSYRYADQVSVGDEVMVLRNDKLMPSKVMDVSSLTMQGNYNISYICLHLSCIFSHPTLLLNPMM